MYSLLNGDLEFFEAIKTSNIKPEDAKLWFKYLKERTDQFIKKNHGWYVTKGYWPIKAKRLDRGEKEPRFTVCHHTSNRQRNYKPALHRFFQAKKASSHFLLTAGREILYLVDIKDLAFHAFNRSYSTDIARLLNAERGWINEVGIEVPGNGNVKLFNPDQFLSVICLHRYLFAHFPTLEIIKSHRFFSPVSRRGDPGPLFFLPLVEHAIKNDIDLNTKDYWLEEYKKDPVKFANSSYETIKNYGLLDSDEWSRKRKSLKIDKSYF